MPALLDRAALERSEIVANAHMNRGRNLAGGNSYEKDLGFLPMDFLKRRLEEQQEVAWLDLCCGVGRALIQTAADCRASGLSDRVRLLGVDLIPMFESIPTGLGGIILIADSVERWITAERFDLVTCVHGLHYVGDKLGLLQRAASWLKPGGLMVAHLDYQNLRIKGQTSPARQIGRDLRRAGFQYIRGRHLVRIIPPLRTVLPYRYLGADDTAGPNYTGQAADSGTR